MAVSWNKEQSEAIKTTDKGVVVSAAAGSGKTAVLIERTIRILTDEEKKVPADKLLAVTFTKDATNQMKDKLSAALEKKLNENPANEWIQKQQDNLSMAKINTINAFCLDLVKNNIHQFDLQSGIKIIDETEANIILNQAVKYAFDFYFQNEPELMDMLIDKLTDNSQKALENIIKDMYFFLRSLPFPTSWAREISDKLKSCESIDLYTNVVFSDYLDRINKACKKSDHAMYLLERFNNTDDKNKNLFISDRNLIYDLHDVLESGKWNEVYDSFTSLKFSSSRITLKLSKNESEDEVYFQSAIIDGLRALRKEYMSIVKDIASDMKKTGRSLSESLLISADIFNGLYKLCTKTEELSWEAKKEKNFLEFSDVEMMAIKLLVSKTDKGIERTELAEEIVRNREYQVILIDEFQDVNNLQELIFKAISDTDDLSVMGKNVFVVGDVKQSIYRFRQSNPLLFLQAKQTAGDAKLTQLKSVQLKRNYRSRKNIIDYVNFTFSLLMSVSVGEIEYNDDEKLQLGADYKNQDFDTEIMLIKDDDIQSDEKSENENISSEHLTFEREHLAVAKRIKEIYDSKCTVEDNGLFRQCRPSDFCVLSRGKKDGLQIAKALESVGLKAYSEESSGYLRSREIAVMINLLKVIDNPMQDIPMVSVMMSPVFGFSADETAAVRLLCRDKTGNYSKRIYQVINGISKDAENSEKATSLSLNGDLKNKCIYAVTMIKKLRLYSSSMTLERLIRKIYDETDFFAVASAFENSKQKRANLRLLLEYASSYESNSEGGISGFLRYLDSASKNGGDFKQAVTVIESKDSVVVKTIHKSKGLEYPFVFLCGLSKKFNLKDVSKRVLFNEKFGAAMKISDHKELSLTEPINYKAQKIIGLNETLSEELRLLYVAMTRAKEKLFIALNLRHGSRSDLDDYAMIRKKAHDISEAGGINPSLVKECKNFSQWIYMTLLCAEDNEILLNEAEVDCELPQISSESEIKFRIYEDLDKCQPTDNMFIREKPNPGQVEQLVDKYNFKYVSDELNAPAKMTVTEIVSDEKEKEFGERNPEFYPQLPKLADEITKLSASERGTYTHLFMELADYDKAAANVQDELERLYSKGFLTEREKQGVYIDALKKFFSGEFFDRIMKSKNVIREKSFLVNFKDIKVGNKYQKYIDGNGMLQGIADCIFEEDGGYVLVDYKTDNFKELSELMKYQTQLELYKAALDLILDAPVKSCYIYSFKLAKGVEIPMV